MDLSIVKVLFRELRPDNAGGCCPLPAERANVFQICKEEDEGKKQKGQDALPDVDDVRTRK
jgi:hypothetical protein